MGEVWDWCRIQYEACPQCGYDTSRVPVRDLPVAVVVEGRAWHDWLLAACRHPAAAAQLATRTGDDWSAIEYACHVRDLLGVYAGRVVSVLTSHQPDLGWWDHEAAATDERYADQHAESVAKDLLRNARYFAAILTKVRGDAHQRVGFHQGRDEYTIAGLGRVTLHELRHHLLDVKDPSR